MAVIYVEELTCDFCGKRINDPSAGLRGRLELRRPHAKGTGRTVEIALHSVCQGKLTAKATKR